MLCMDVGKGIRSVNKSELLFHQAPDFFCLRSSVDVAWRMVPAANRPVEAISICWRFVGVF